MGSNSLKIIHPNGARKTLARRNGFTNNNFVMEIIVSFKIEKITTGKNEKIKKFQRDYYFS